MNVLIIELGGSHIECVYTFVHLLELKKSAIHLICNKKLATLFLEKNRLHSLYEVPDVLPLQKQMAVFFLIRKLIREKEIDTVIINTVDSKIIRNLVFFMPKINCIGLTHNAKRLVNSFTYSKLLLRRIKKFLVLGDFLLKQNPPDPHFKADSFYPVYFPPLSGNVIEKKDGETWIVIPGEVSEERRNYLGLINMVVAAKIPANIRFIFLGKLYDGKVRTALTDSGLWETQLLSFENIIGYEQFHSYIRQADIILPLLKDEEPGFYGNQRISGSFNLALGYKLPLLLPSSYKRNTDLAPFSLYYDGFEELGRIVLQIKQRPEIKGILSSYGHSKLTDFNSLADKLYNFINL